MKTIEVEVYIIADHAGDSAQGDSPAAAREAYENNIQALNECDGFRMCKITVTVPLPEVAVLEMKASLEPLADAIAS
jgi:hypothetical protein